METISGTNGVVELPVKSKDDTEPECSFEDAVEKTGCGIFHYWLLLTNGLALLGVVIEGLNMAFVLPAAKCELSISTGEQGLINAVAFIGVVLTSHFWGFLADTWGRRKVLQLSLGLGFVFSFISSFSVSSIMLLITRLIVGSTLSGVQAAAISYLGEFHSNVTRVRHVTFAAMFMTISVVLQAVMGVVIMPRSWQFQAGAILVRPWRMYLMLSSCLTLLAFVSISFLPESPKFMLAMGRPDEAVRILRIAYSANGLGKRKDFPVSRITSEMRGSNLADIRGIGGMFKMMWKQTRPLLLKEHIGNVLLMCYLTFSLFAVAHGFYMWYPQVLNLYYPNMNSPITVCRSVDLGFASIPDITPNTTIRYFDLAARSQSDCNGAGDPVTYYIIMIMGAFFMFMYFIIALTSNRFGMKALLTTWLLLATVAALALFWTNDFYANQALLILMLTCGNCGSVLSAVAADLFPTHFKGMALCFVMMFGRIGSVVGSNVVGALLNGNCEWIFGICTATLVVSSCLCYYVLHKKDKLQK